MENTEFFSRNKAEGIRFIDLRFTDLRGGWHHITADADAADKAAWERGIPFDASRISGLAEADCAGMALRPAAETAHNDPFFAEKTAAVICDVMDASSGEACLHDPRGIARHCEDYAARQGFCDEIRLGLTAEFFVFDDVRFENSPYHSFYRLDAAELPVNSGRNYEMGNSGCRPQGRGDMPLPPADSGQDMRAEMLNMLKDMGIEAERHQHGRAAAQHELSLKSGGLLRQADIMQMLKYAVRQAAAAYGRSACFMPKPVFGESGSALPVSISLRQGGRPLFAGGGYSGLSETALYFIGGILRHMRALNALANPSTNSYKRLRAGCGAPALTAYSADNRLAACHIPYAFSDEEKRVEMRFPDAAANPYLAFAALTMAGLDGIKHKISPGEPIGRGIAEQAAVPAMSGSLAEALDALDKDRDFLKAGDVFSDAALDCYIAMKRREAEQVEAAPHPAEFALYYAV